MRCTYLEASGMNRGMGNVGAEFKSVLLRRGLFCGACGDTWWRVCVLSEYLNIWSGSTDNVLKKEEGPERRGISAGPQGGSSGTYKKGIVCRLLFYLLEKAVCKFGRGPYLLEWIIRYLSPFAKWFSGCFDRNWHFFDLNGFNPQLHDNSCIFFPLLTRFVPMSNWKF